MDLADLIAGLVILVGLVGIVVPVLPGTLLVAAGLVGWALAVASAPAWLLTAAGLTLLTVGGVVKYAVPGRRLRTAGVPASTLLCGAVLAAVGFFVVPIVGLVMGFVLGVYLSEAHRQGTARAWPATRAALAAVGLALLIELAAGLGAATLWLFGAFST